MLLIALFYISLPLGAYGLSYWLPTVVKGFGVTNTVNGFLNVIPWACVAWALWWVPRHAARTGEQTWHIALPAFIGAACLAASVFVPGNAAKFALLCVAASGIFAAQPVFWSLPSTFLKGAGGGGGLRGYQLGGQPGRLLRAERRPLDPGSDAQRHGTHVVSVRLPDGRRADDLRGPAAYAAGGSLNAQARMAAIIASDTFSSISAAC